jgi:hypothetical protein
MKEIQLTRNKVALVDNEDFEWLSTLNWFAKPHHGNWYAIGNIGRDDKTRYTCSMHRFILKPPKYIAIDHIDTNGLNNQRSNLRICTNSQNAMNRKISRVNTTGFKGVYSENNKWRAQIKMNQKIFFIGMFSDKIAAAHAYDQKAIELFGEFSRLNFPQQKESNETIIS